MKSINDIKAEISEEVGEPHGFDFLVEVEDDSGVHERVIWLYEELLKRYRLEVERENKI